MPPGASGFARVADGDGCVHIRIPESRWGHARSRSPPAGTHPVETTPDRDMPGRDAPDRDMPGRARGGAGIGSVGFAMGDRDAADYGGLTREWRNGRRAVFRWQCPYGRGGSNPPSRTTRTTRAPGRPTRGPGRVLRRFGRALRRGGPSPAARRPSSGSVVRASCSRTGNGRPRRGGGPRSVLDGIPGTRGSPPIAGPAVTTRARLAGTGRGMPGPPQGHRIPPPGPSSRRSRYARTTAGAPDTSTQLRPSPVEVGQGHRSPRRESAVRG